MNTLTTNLTLDSREVAKMVEKDHSNLMRDIRTYMNQMDEANEKMNSDLNPSNYFTESTYFDEYKREKPCYEITKMGCEFIANKMTGVKGTAFTAKYVERFNKMEETLKNPYQGLSKEVQAIFAIDKKQQVLEGRITKLENNTTIDYGQQEELRELANKSTVNALGYGTPAYKELNKKAFSSIWKDFKRVMQVNSYKNTLIKDFAKAKEFLSNWKPGRDLELMIKGANSQVSM